MCFLSSLFILFAPEGCLLKSIKEPLEAKTEFMNIVNDEI